MKNLLASSSSLLAALGVASGSVTLSRSDGFIKVDNGFVSLQLSLSGGPWISALKGDFQGRAKYGENVLMSGGIRLERINADGHIVSAASEGEQAVVNVIRNDGVCVELDLPSVLDDFADPTAKESWFLSLCDNDRYFVFKTSGGVLDSAVQAGKQARAVLHTMYSSPLSTFGFYSQGVVQMKEGDGSRSYFGSSDVLSRVYALGGSGSVDVLRTGSSGGDSDVTVLMNAASNDAFYSGFQEVLFGAYDQKDAWTSGWGSSETTTAFREATWTREWKVSPNNRNFPSATLPSGSVSNMDDGNDLESLMTGIYANSVGCLCTYPGAVRQGHQVGQIATTIRIDNGHGYNDTYNYFDPDNFIGLTAMLYSGDEFLQNQARTVIERSGSFLKPENGQLPHHFNGIEPYYLALSGETQTGPNTFWVKTALQYAFVSGDIEWLSDYMPTLRNASSFVFDLIDPDKQLINAPGSLMIDVFIRNNYTSDSNAMVVGFLRDFAEAERAVGNGDRASELEAQADAVAEAMNKQLWASSDTGGDHYITQLNMDGSIRDFVDYDSNLIAVAHGVPDEARSRSIFSRIDGGRCSASTGAGPQFVSEEYYGEEDTTNGNQGDSWCSMARIGWFDAHARKRFGTQDDLNYFNDRLLSTVQNDLLPNTWMHERYGCDGAQQENRTMYYFEYPSYVAMILREVKYGIELRMTDVTVNPFGPTEFEYHIGNIDVEYSKNRVSISAPGAGQREYKIHGLNPDSEYLVWVTKECLRQDLSHFNKYLDGVKVVSNAVGYVSFSAPIGGTACVVTAKATADY